MWLGVLLLIGVVTFYYLCDPMHVSVLPTCPVLKVTGWQCAGCGSQRALHALLHLDIASAWRFNPLLLVALPYVALGIVVERLAMHKEEWARFRKTCFGQRAAWLALVVVVVYSVARNVDW